MACHNATVTDGYALYHGDCVEVLADLPADCVDLSVYSPPFAGLYHYSSDDRDISNARNFDEFMQHYGFVVRDLARVTKPGRMTAVHCADVPTGNSGLDGLLDLPGEIIRLHKEAGWTYVARYAVWKEPFRVRMRTLAKGLAHRTIVDDASRCSNAAADYVLVFRNAGVNHTPITHPRGLTTYAGAREVPPELLGYRGWEGSHLENRYSHWVWRQYASAFWDDVRIDRVLPFQPAKDDIDEKHVHPLQLDVIERIVTLWSNPGEVVFTPFLGVGSEAYGAVQLQRKAIGVELKESYYRQAIKNMSLAEDESEQIDLLGHGPDLTDEVSLDEVSASRYDETTRAAVSRSGRWLGKS